MEPHDQSSINWKDWIPRVAFLATCIPAAAMPRRLAKVDATVSKHFFTVQTAGRFFCGGFLARTLIEKFAGELGSPLKEKTPEKMFNNTMLLTWAATNALAFGLHPTIGFAAVFMTTGCEAARAFNYGIKKFYPESD